jgi:hypothetical protein
MDNLQVYNNRLIAAWDCATAGKDIAQTANVLPACEPFKKGCERFSTVCYVTFCLQVRAG